MTDDAGPVPGTIEVPGRMFLYIEEADPSRFQDTFNELSAHFSDERLPKSGGIITENTVLVVPTGASFCGVSFKGDLKAWEAGVLSYTLAQGRRVLRIRGVRVELSDGASWPLAECRKSTYEVRRAGRKPSRSSSGRRSRPTRS